MSSFYMSWTKWLLLLVIEQKSIWSYIHFFIYSTLATQTTWSTSECIAIGLLCKMRTFNLSAYIHRITAFFNNESVTKHCFQIYAGTIWRGEFSSILILTWRFVCFPARDAPSKLTINSFTAQSKPGTRSIRFGRNKLVS